LNNYKQSCKPNKQQGQCCQQLNYSDLAIKTALTTKLRFKIGPLKVKNYVLRISY